MMFSFSSMASITDESTLIGAVPRSPSTTVSTVGSIEAACSVAGAASAPAAASNATAQRMVSFCMSERTPCCVARPPGRGPCAATGGAAMFLDQPFRLPIIIPFTK